MNMAKLSKKPIAKKTNKKPGKKKAAKTKSSAKKAVVKSAARSKKPSKKKASKKKPSKKKPAKKKSAPKMSGMGVAKSYIDPFAGIGRAITVNFPVPGANNCPTPLVANGTLGPGCSVTDATISQEGQADIIGTPVPTTPGWSFTFDNVPCGVPLALIINGTDANGNPVQIVTSFTCICPSPGPTPTPLIA
jgi:hypothetical protein